LEAAAWALALCTALYVIVGPFLVARYPMMTDLPFHAANASIIRHYWDPSWHFQEQFVLQPFAVPYVMLYLIAALLMLVMSAVSAIKVAAAIMLALLPVGLAVLFWGMRKSPLLGLSGLGFVWCGLTSWGFLGFVGALGLFAMLLGLVLRQAQRPSSRLGIAITVVLLLLFFTHPFRFPFAMAAVAVAAFVMYPATRRVGPLLWPVVVPLGLFALWWRVRPAALSPELPVPSIHPERLDEAGRFLYRSLRVPAEAAAAGRALDALLALALALVLFYTLERRWRLRSRQRLFQLGALVMVLGCAGVFLMLYLTLPMKMGIWWYVYPREITSACFVALALLPDLPRRAGLKLVCVAWMCWALAPLGSVTVDSYRRFDQATQDFTSISAKLPQAPKLLYLVFDHHGSDARNTPFIHLPAYVQAERGGWLSFHFASWGASAIAYRSPEHVAVPPATPLRWEWTPHRFRVAQHGRFFDWFLVRARRSPEAHFARDPSISLVAHEGSWWLLSRSAGVREP
jgi:hypothetical protein